MIKLLSKRFALVIAIALTFAAAPVAFDTAFADNNNGNNSNNPPNTAGGGSGGGGGDGSGNGHPGKSGPGNS